MIDRRNPVIFVLYKGSRYIFLRFAAKKTRTDVRCDKIM